MIFFPSRRRAIPRPIQLRETAIKSSAKDERINEMRHELDTLKSEHELMNQSNNQLRLRVRELESNMNSYESIGNKSSFTISALQKECKDKQDQVFELQSRIRYTVSVRRSLFSSYHRTNRLEHTWKNAKHTREGTMV